MGQENVSLLYSLMNLQENHGFYHLQKNLKFQRLQFNFLSIFTNNVMIKLDSLKLIIVGNSKTEKLKITVLIMVLKKIYSPQYNQQNKEKNEFFNYTL